MVGTSNLGSDFSQNSQGLIMQGWCLEMDLIRTRARAHTPWRGSKYRTTLQHSSNRGANHEAGIEGWRSSAICALTSDHSLAMLPGCGRGAPWSVASSGSPRTCCPTRPAAKRCSLRGRPRVSHRLDDEWHCYHSTITTALNDPVGEGQFCVAMNLAVERPLGGKWHSHMSPPTALPSQVPEMAIDTWIYWFYWSCSAGYGLVRFDWIFRNGFLHQGIILYAIYCCKVATPMP